MIARAILCLAATVSLTTPLFADDYESGLYGDQIVPVESRDIRMASERVDIAAEWPIGGFDHMPYRVDAEFVLVNESGKPQSILVSFPGDEGIGCFSRTVDGQAVEVTRYESRDKKWFYAFTSRIEFAPGQTRKVRVRYLGIADAGSGGGNWSYVLRTGAHWKGTIGEAVVSIRFPPDTPTLGHYDGWETAEDLRLSPANYTVKDRTVTWTFRDFEPTEDIDVAYRCPEYDDQNKPIPPPPNPLRLPPEAEKVNLLLLAGKNLESSPGQALAVYEALRRTFPDSYEARTLDFYIARVYGRHRFCGDDPGFEGHDPKRAVVHYEAALRQPIPKEHRWIALAELFVLYSTEAPDANQARRVLDLLKKERMPWSNRNRTLVEGIGSFSPKVALELIDSMSFGPEEAEAVRDCTELLRTRTEQEDAAPA